MSLGHPRVSLASGASPSVVSLLEHVEGRSVQGPVAALAHGPSRIEGSLFQTEAPVGGQGYLLSGHFHEAVVQGQIVADRVLPALLVVPVVGEPVHDELVDAAQGQPLLGRTADGHRDQGDVGEGRLLCPFPRRARWSRGREVQLVHGVEGGQVVDG